MRMKIISGGCVALLLAGAALAQQPTSPQTPPLNQTPEIAVPGQRVLPVPKKLDDPRTIQQRTLDRRAFERCLLRMQSRAAESTASGPMDIDPTEYCQRLTTMRTSTSAPTGR